MANKPTINLNDYLINKAMQSAGLYTKDQIDVYNKFTRFGLMDPYNRINHTKEYFFLTKPDLHIFKNGALNVLNPQISNMPIFAEAVSRYPDVLKSLQYSVDKSNPFINLLSNKKTSNVDLPSIHADEIETSANLYGTRLFYRRASDKSNEEYEFSIEYEDTKRLEVYMFFRLFDEYENKKMHGGITPPNAEYYTFNKIVHDQMTGFKFIVGDDGETIIHYSMIWGVYPKSCPREAFSEIPEGGPFKFTVSYKGQLVEDMDPSIISDFNALTRGKFKERMHMYDYDIGSVSGEWPTYPYIISERSAYGPSVYKLTWWR